MVRFSLARTGWLGRCWRRWGRRKLGSAGVPGTGGLLTADPIEEHEALTQARQASERKALTALREHQERNGSSNGETNGHH